MSERAPAKKAEGASSAGPPDPDRFDAWMERMIGELGAAMGAPLVILGEELGLYRALATEGPLDADGLAARTETDARYVREWLAQQAAAGYLEHDAEARRFHLSPEAAATLASPGGPADLVASFHMVRAMMLSVPRLRDAFRSGRGVDWGEHDTCLCCATSRHFGGVYQRELIESWLPALDGVVARLGSGGKIADVGCGQGYAAMLMAEAFPRSEVIGVDLHGPSIEHARAEARRRGLKGVRFEQGALAELTLRDLHLVSALDMLHDLGDPVTAAARVREALAPDGVFMVVEPAAEDGLAANLANPFARMGYAASTMFCVPNARSQGGRYELGAQAGAQQIEAVLREAGFSSVRVAVRTPMSLVIEARA